MKRIVFMVTVILLVTAAGAAVFAGGQQEAARARQELDFGLSGNPDTLDPHATSGTLTFQVIRSFYDTLVEPNREGVLVPALAESWDVSDDAMTWTFTIRDGVVFHNGDELSSEDVKATFERIMSEETASPKASEFTAIEEIRTPDDLTVVLELSQPAAPLLASMASGWGAILPASLIESGHDFATQPVGTGPFEFVEWIPDSRIVMEKFADYWVSGAPSLEKVTINIIPENSVQVQALVSGELDAIDSINPQDLPMLEANASVAVQQDLSALVMVLAMNTEREPMSRLAVRQAVNRAIDKQVVMDVAYGGGETVGTFMDVTDPFYVDFTALYSYDPAKAEELLAESSYDPSEPLVMALPEVFEAHVRAGEMYQEMLEDVGFNVELRLVDWSTWINDVFRGGNYDFTVIGHTGKLDPHGRLGGYGTKDSYVKWVNEEAASLIEEARQTVEFEDRKALYDRVLEIMAREVPQAYVGTSYRYLARRSNVVGLHQDPKLDTFDFRYVEIE
jgi:peptide/nickel transport system substrate-binding protein